MAKIQTHCAQIFKYQKMFQGLGSGRPRRINMTCRTDDSTWNTTGRGFIHKWPKPRHDPCQFSSENASDAKNVVEMIPHEIKRAAVLYINDQNPDTICTHFQVINNTRCNKSRRDDSTWNPTGRGFLHKWSKPNIILLLLMYCCVNVDAVQV